MSSKNIPWWKTTGMLVAGGWHPLAGRLRNRIPEENIEEEYEWEYTEDHILRLKELGITVLVGQYDRGLGDTDQAESQEKARLQAELCHKHGIKHGVYMPNTIYYESMLKDYPDCEDWVVKTHDGGKTYYGGEQTWRWVACMNAPGWRSHIKRSVEKAIKYVKTDWLHFDNLGQSLAPQHCHCKYCQESFRKFLAERYPDAESQKRRFGYTGFDTFRIQVFFPKFAEPWSIDRFRSPLFQEWLDWRIATVTGYIAEMSAYARQLKPDICIDSNGQAFHGNNTGLTQGRGDNEGQAAYVDVLWEENPDLRPDDDPRAVIPVTCKFRGFLHARRMNKIMLSAYREEESLAFNLTFSGHPAINSRWGYAEPGKMPLNDHQPGVKELLDHYKRNLALYIGAGPACRVAVWRNQKSLAYVSTDTYLSASVVEQTLFNHRIPFSIVQDGFINDEKLGEFDLVILPDVEFVSDEQVAALTRFVENGGRLLITEHSGMYTSEPRIRKTPAFAHLFAGEYNGSSAKLEENATIDEHKQFALKLDGGDPACASFGKGRAAYLPKLDYIYKPHTFKSGYNIHYDGIDSRYWKEPYNAAEVLTTLDWLYPALYPVKVYGVPELRLDYLKLEDGAEAVTMIRCGELGGARNVPFSIMAGKAPAESALYVPERDEPVALTWTQCNGRVETVLPGVSRHAVVRFKI